MNITTESINRTEENEDVEEEIYIKNFHGSVIVFTIFKNMISAQ